MRKHLSLIGVLLALVVFHLGPNAEAQLELGDGYLYASPGLLLGINFDFVGCSGLEFYPSLSAQVTGGIAIDDYSSWSIVGATLGYQLSFGHPSNLYIDLQGGIVTWPYGAGAGVGWAWQPSAKESSIRGKLFWPFRAGIGIEYDSGKRLKPYLYGSETGNLRSNALEF